MAKEKCSCVKDYFPNEWCLVCNGTDEVEAIKERPTCLDCNDSGINKEGNGWPPVIDEGVSHDRHTMFLHWSSLPILLWCWYCSGYAD